MVKRAVVVGFLAVALAGITLAGEAGAQVPPLSPLQVSGPPNLGDFVRDDEAAKVLGEALFWDSSDGVQACATCHLRAGADPRRKNQISPGLLRVVNQIGPVVSAPDFDLPPVQRREPFGNRDANAFLYRADDPSNPGRRPCPFMCLVIPRIMSDSR